MRFYFVVLSCFMICFSTSCRRGCTDYEAINYSSDALNDDGSCIVGGCNDPKALNYSASARLNDGTCMYPGSVSIFNQISLDDLEYIEVYWNGDYAGELLHVCPESGLGCYSDCDQVSFKDLSPGTYSYFAVKKPAKDTLFRGFVTVGATQCRYLVIK